MASAKTFTPSIESMQQAESWLRIFAADIMGRMADQEGRRPRTVAVHHQKHGRFGPTRSKQGQIPWGSKLDAQLLYNLARSILLDLSHEEPSWPCLTLSISVSDIVDTDTTSQSLTSFWTVKQDSERETSEIPTQNSLVMPKAIGKGSKRTLFDYQAVSHQHCQIHHTKECGCEQESPHKRQRNVTPTAIEQAITSASETDEPSSGQYQCPKCNKAVAAADVLEHLDWHVAMDLQDQGS